MMASIGWSDPFFSVEVRGSEIIARKGEFLRGLL
jgi:hypothetical protein